jgi:hypothetical protein
MPQTAARGSLYTASVRCHLANLVAMHLSHVDDTEDRAAARDIDCCVNTLSNRGSRGIASVAAEHRSQNIPTLGCVVTETQGQPD